MTTEAQFQAALDADPSDHMIRLAFADWLEEQDPPDPRGPGYRALGLGEHRPCVSVGPEYCPWFAREGVTSVGTLEYPKTALPPDWFDAIELEGKMGGFAPNHDYRVIATRAEVEDAAALAFARLPAQRRAELLATVEMPA